MGRFSLAFPRKKKKERRNVTITYNEKEKEKQNNEIYTCIHRDNSRPIPSIRIHERPGFEKKKKRKRKKSKQEVVSVAQSYRIKHKREDTLLR